MDYLAPVLCTLAAVVVLWLLYAFVTAGGLGRYFAARQIAGRWLRDQKFAGKVNALIEPEKPAAPPRPSGEPLRLLALLQREGRLLDFLLEDIQAYSNDQIGAAVRDIHKNCQKAINDHVTIEPVLAQAEGASVEVAAGFDPGAIRLTGNVTGEPPFRGTLQHHGWRVKELKLAKPPQGQDEFVVHPAEVEMP
ncbi:MAG: DUF2760 domain-containing protein [Gemmataceae bacterium]|nr:DUF2760 domain-containing protein [Gemmataceae bacterium]